MSTPIGMRIPPHIGRQGMEAVVKWAREAGLGALDLPAVNPEAAGLCRQHGLRIGTVDAGGVARLLSPDADARRQAAADVREQIAGAREIGASVMFMCLVPEDRAQSLSTSLSLFAESFPAVASACEEYGVRIAFEGWPGPAPHYPTLGCTPEVWRAMFAAVPSKALGLCFDPSHLIRLGIDYLRVLAEFGDRVYHCHGKDTDLLPEAQYLYGALPPALSAPAGFSGGAWRYCIPGTGRADWSRIAYELERLNYGGCVSVELEDARYWGSLAQEQAGVGKARAHLAQWFA